MTDADLNAARARVVERGLTADAVGHLTQVVSDLSIEALGPVKQALKRFFSDEPWTDDDDEVLADAVGTGTGSGRKELEQGLTLVWGWDGGRFRLRVESDDPNTPGPAAPQTAAEPAETVARQIDGPRSPVRGDDTDLAQTFEGAVVPEATPSPRTIRFATPELHAGPGRTYDSADAAAADSRVARLFGDFDAVTNVLVGPDFVAVTLSRPDRWETLLAPILGVVTEEFTGEDDEDATPEAPMTISFTVGTEEEDVRAPRRLERAWSELGALRADRPEHLERVLAASHDREPARRQVAAALLADAPAEAAARAWERLLGDSSRVVRRSVVDAVAGTGREELRPLLDRAADDADAWVRWKALRGIADLGVGPSRATVEARAADPDFRVRLEAARVLAGASG
jgi:hypothetical protein